MAVKAIFGTGSGELSLLFALFYLHAGGGLTNLARTTGGAQERRFDGGSQQLAEGMAAELGERVLLGAPVETVAYGSDHVAVGRRLVAPGADPADPAAAHRTTAGRAPGAPIFAMAPALCGRLAYMPALPGRRDQLCQRMPMGAVTKVHVLYDEPFWRAEGLNGQIVAPGGGHGERVRQLARGRIARRHRRLHRRRRLPAHGGRRARGPPGGRAGRPRACLRAHGRGTPVEIVEQHWPAEPFTRGGPVAVSVPGALTALGAGAARCRSGRCTGPARRRRRSGAATSTARSSAGIRAADEVLHALKGEPVGLD